MAPPIINSSMKMMIDKLRKSFADDCLEHLVFVYGTLKKSLSVVKFFFAFYKIFFNLIFLKQGQPNHPVLVESKNGQAKFICNGQTLDRWPLVIASQYNIPYLLYKSDTGHVCLFIDLIQ